MRNGGIASGTRIRRSRRNSLFGSQCRPREQKCSRCSASPTHGSYPHRSLEALMRDKLSKAVAVGETEGAGIFNKVGRPTSRRLSSSCREHFATKQGIRGGASPTRSLDITNSTISGQQASGGGGIADLSSGVVNIISAPSRTMRRVSLAANHGTEQGWRGGSLILDKEYRGNKILAGNRDGRTPSIILCT